MHHFHLEFAYPWAPWLFLLLIPAILLTLIPYFRTNKKFRRTRNRVISIVLHTLALTLTVCVLTGLTFAYEVSNPENELILLVDVSDTQDNVSERRDILVRDILTESSYDGYCVGVVTFGFTQVYAVPLTYDVDSAYDSYLNAELPDTSATDIAAALRYTRGLFDNPKTSKIVLITDGKETDERAASVIGSIAAQGTKVDAVNIASEFVSDFVQVTDVQFPDYHIDVDEDCAITVTLQSKVETDASTVQLYDNGAADEESIVSIGLTEGQQTLVLHKTFSTAGLHEIKIKVSDGIDGMEQNNEYCSYIFLERFDHILILEQKEGQSVSLENLLGQEGAEYRVDVCNLNTSEDVPETVDELREYDQIILNNIASADLKPFHLEELLYSYVYDFGGGLFTVGGSDDAEEAHAYNRKDLNNSILQQMLPVQAINYTPPVGVIVIIDISGSMESGWTDGISKLDWAKQGAIACLDALTERDYLGVLTLATSFRKELDPTPCTRSTYIKEAISSIDGTGGTLYSDAIYRAGQQLTTLVNNGVVDRGHIVIVSDGVPAGSDRDAYLENTRDIVGDGETVTLSAVGIDVGEGSDAEKTLDELVEVGHGRLHTVSAGTELIDEMKEDLNAPEIKEMKDEPFRPAVNDALSPLLNGVEYGSLEEGGDELLDVQLGGFYGVKARTGIKPVLVGEYQVPIYAQWKFGAGMVGSFMSDLNGRWSADFLADANAQQFLFNVVSNLMPTENIRPSEITAELRADNYINQLNIYTELGKGETVRARLEDVGTGDTVSLNALTEFEGDADVYVTLALGAENNYTRSNFVLKKNGTYRIVIEKCDAEGTVLAAKELYKTFSYSLEYDQNIDTAEQNIMLSDLADRGGGVLIAGEEEIYKIFETFDSSLSHSFDPRWLFMAIAMVLVLLDVVVRKFKFKWPHEIVRARREKKAETQRRRTP